MQRPRIVIIDTDINYIMPLQQKFIEEYFEKIDLEIINDPDYYEYFFSFPQEIDILIISEEFYKLDIFKHNIKNIILLTERYPMNQKDEEQVNRIYKYTSLKEIFNSIEGKCQKVFDYSGETKKETKIILIYSVCGGSGKTTIALGISACLNKNYKKVLYLNAARLQSFQTMLSDMSPIKAPDIYDKLIDAEKNVYLNIKEEIRNEGFSYVPAFRAALMTMGIKYSVYKDIALSAKQSEEYDYIIIDADTVLDNDKCELIDIADKVVYVIRQDKASVYAANAFVMNVNGANSDKFLFICNDFSEKYENILISPDIRKRFVVSEYVEHFIEQDQINDLANKYAIQKVTFLIS